MLLHKYSSDFLLRNTFCDFENFIHRNISHYHMRYTILPPVENINRDSTFYSTRSQRCVHVTNFYNFIGRMLIIKQRLVPRLDN